MGPTFEGSTAVGGHTIRNSCIVSLRNTSITNLGVEAKLIGEQQHIRFSLESNCGDLDKVDKRDYFIGRQI